VPSPLPFSFFPRVLNPRQARTCTLARAKSPFIAAPRTGVLLLGPSRSLTFAFGTALPAPHLPFANPVGNGSVGWKADIRSDFPLPKRLKGAILSLKVPENWRMSCHKMNHS
jgi:hypothetical protein